jgi:hypothetical protein
MAETWLVTVMLVEMLLELMDDTEALTPAAANAAPP